MSRQIKLSITSAADSYRFVIKNVYGSDIDIDIDLDNYDPDPDNNVNNFRYDNTTNANSSRQSNTQRPSNLSSASRPSNTSDLGSNIYGPLNMMGLIFPEIDGFERMAENRRNMSQTHTPQTSTNQTNTPQMSQTSQPNTLQTSQANTPQTSQPNTSQANTPAPLNTTNTRVSRSRLLNPAGTSTNVSTNASTNPSANLTDRPATRHLPDHFEPIIDMKGNRNRPKQDYDSLIASRINRFPASASRLENARDVLNTFDDWIRRSMITQDVGTPDYNFVCRLDVLFGMFYLKIVKELSDDEFQTMIRIMESPILGETNVQKIARERLLATMLGLKEGKLDSIMTSLCSAYCNCDMCML